MSHSNNCCVVHKPAICEDLDLHVAIFVTFIAYYEMHAFVSHWDVDIILTKTFSYVLNISALVLLWVPVADPGFSWGGGVNPPGGAWTRQIFPKTAWNRKNLDAQGGRASLTPPPRSANGSTSSSFLRSPTHWHYKTTKHANPVRLS